MTTNTQSKESSELQNLEDHADESKSKSTVEARKHFKVGSRKSKLAMVQTEYIIGRLKEQNPDYTFEIVNFDTKGDKILNVALPKIGDKGLFTKELEDALENGSIDFVVHSLKDMPCQTLPDNLIISCVPEREDPCDALVMSACHMGKKCSLDDLEPNSVVGTSSLRRIAQLKMKYPHLKFETIRGNLQTRFAKLDDENEKKFDCIILAAAGLKRMDYRDRITQILPPETCMHAVSQGALGIESRHDDLFMIQMLNQLNHEETLLRCIAERTFLAKLEGGCSTPIGVWSQVTENSIVLEGAIFELDGKYSIKEKFEMRFDSSTNCPVIDLIASHEANEPEHAETRLKRKSESEDADVEAWSSSKRRKNSNNTSQAEKPNHYCFIVDTKIDQNKLMKAELCGLHLAQKIKEKGGDVLINEIKAAIHNK